MSLGVASHGPVDERSSPRDETPGILDRARFSSGRDDGIDDDEPYPPSAHRRVRREPWWRSLISQLRRLYEASAVRPGDYPERVHAGLEVVREALGMSVGILVRIDDEAYTIVASSSNASSSNEPASGPSSAYTPGTSGNLDATFFALTLTLDRVLAIPHVSESPYRDALWHRRHGFEAYVGARVTVDGEPYGTVSFASTTPSARRFSPEDESLVELVAAWMGTMIAVWQQSRHRREDRERFRLLAEAAFEAVLVLRDGRVIEANEAFTAMFGYARDQALGRREADFFASSGSGRTHEQPGDDAVASTEVTAVRRDGSTFIAHTRTRSLPVHDGNLRVTAIQDVTLQKGIEASLRRDALHDPLTGLKNRAAFADAVEQAASRAARHADYGYAVLFIDLDRFKSVNDRFGHAAGDELLAAIGRRLRESVREVDVAARLGGDEFVVLLDDVRDEATAHDLAVRLQAALTTPLLVAGRPLRLDCSIGIGLEPGRHGDPEHRDPERLVRDADAAMYRAKAGGEGRIVLFHDVMQRDPQRSALVEDQLEQALAQEAFALAYQPIVDLADARPVAVEAIVRWVPGDGTIVAPSDVIDIAETTGHIVQIDDWVLTNAVRQAARRLGEGAGADAFVHVHLSARQFTLSSGLPRRVQALLDEHGLPATHLALGATEAALMRDPEQSVRVMHDLDDLGVRLHVGHVGAGGSHLAQLGRFPIDMLKIGGGLVRAMTTDPASRRAVRSILALGEGLDLEVVAVDVETDAHVRILRDLGCRYGQGPVFRA